MDDAKIREDLSKADEQIRKAEARILQQGARITRLSAQGYSTDLAEELLGKFRRTLENMVQQRKIIVGESRTKEIAHLK
jgi:hypothetical protein